jgi:hypothetical protein
VLSAGSLCPQVRTVLNPGAATATTTVQRVAIGLPGVPVIQASGVTATAASTCTAATGSASLSLTVAGVSVTVPTAPNRVINLAGGAQLIINEQTPVTGADHGISVTALHVVAAGGLADILVASSASGMHNCVS